MKYYIQKIIHVIKWIPVIWKLWGDGYYDILRLLEKQFADMEDSYRNHSHTVSAPHYAKQVHLAGLLVKRLQQDTHTDSAFPYVETGPNFMDFEFVRRPMVPKQELWEYEKYMKQQDLDYLCKIINKNLFYWWD